VFNYNGYMWVLLCDPSTQETNVVF